MNLGFSLQLAEVNQNAIKRLMAKPEFADKMHMESAAVLLLSNNMHHRQWNELAKALDAELTEGEKCKGGVLPVTHAIVKWGALSRYTYFTISLCRSSCRAAL
jgi:hypothetical protein